MPLREQAHDNDGGERHEESGSEFVELIVERDTPNNGGEHVDDHTRDYPPTGRVLPKQTHDQRGTKAGASEKQEDPHRRRTSTAVIIKMACSTSVQRQRR